ncbi:hypothetical protein EDD36DRAFT_414038 [Exophiala viscosa]|uniref:FAD/NAD(P)-binding domain-containing protein n=1 Tax=Exophiala viscosa TaxID=2486360 RepID=A0AAN6E598_9EURO|nr:hypothetical protein EDD36DRAFT_414038 [Exophiala viscosa]
MAKDNLPRVVVIGSGWVGLYSLSVVSPRLTSAYTPLLASAACSLFPFSCAEESIRAKGRRCNLIKANAIEIDFCSNQILCEPAFDDHDSNASDQQFRVAYDRLIICPGCQTNDFGIPGVVEHAMFMKHVSDAMALRKKLLDQFERASLPCTTREDACDMLHIAIVGGGPTGVEITAELSDLARRELKDLYPDVAPSMRITIYDVAPHILGAYDQKLYEYATEQMLQRGIEIVTNAVIERVDRTNLYIKGQNPVPYGILLWVAGNRSIPLVDKLDVKKPEHGLIRILTDDSLRVKKASTDVHGHSDVYPDVFALGDAADIEGRSLPTTAEVAVQKAKYIVRRLNRGATATENFAYADKRLVTYIGSHDGIIEGSGLDEASRGQRAWLDWRSGSFTWTRTWRNWVGLICAYVLNALFGRDFMRL